jgi:hypothetical protein
MMKKSQPDTARDPMMDNFPGRNVREEDCSVSAFIDVPDCTVWMFWK